MRRWKRPLQVILAAMAACLLCFTLAEAKKPDNLGGDKGPSYQIIKLDTDDGAGGTVSGSAFDINDSRLIVGSVSVSIGGETRSRAACWTVTELNGTFESQLQFLDDFLFNSAGAYGCNDWGETVGIADDTIAAYWADTNSPLEELPALLPRSGAEAINNSGVICGWSLTGFSAVDEQRALVWSFTGGQWKCLELVPLGDPGEDEDGNPLPNRAGAVAISDEDAVTGVITVVGQSNGNAVIWTVVLDESGGLLAGPAMILDALAAAWGTNNTGIVCGFGHVGPNRGGDGVVWIDGGPAELLALDDSPGQWGTPRQVFPLDVNDNGVLVGDNSGLAVMWPNKDASLIVLNDFLPRGRKSPFFALGRAHAVNEWNEIVGGGAISENGPLAPFLAIPK